MPRSSYGGDKRRRQIAKKKKRDAKLARKHSKDTGSSGTNEEDTSYLEYLYPGGVPDELLPEDESDEEQDEDEDEE